MLIKTKKHQINTSYSVYDINEWYHFNKGDNNEMLGKTLENLIYLRCIQYDRFALKPHSCQV